MCLRWGGWCTVDSEGWGTDGALVTAVFWGSSMQQMCESRAGVEDSACVRGGGLISAHVWSLSAHMCRWTVCLSVNISTGQHNVTPIEKDKANSALVNCCNENDLGLIRLSNFISSDYRALELANKVYCFYLLHRDFLGKK